MKEQENKFSFKRIWNIVMSLVYMALAYLVVFTPLLLPYNFKDNLKENDDFIIVRGFLGFALFLYGIFRGYRAYQNKK